MSDALSEAKGFVKSVRVFLAVSGAIALIAGLVLLIWPAKSATVVTGIAVAILAVYFIVAGLVYLALSIFSKEKGGWSRVGHALLGLVFIAAGVVMFIHFFASSVALAFVVIIFIGVSWIIEGIVSLSLLKHSTSKVWTVIFAIISILAGVFVLFEPLYGAATLWLVLGIILVVLGIVQIVRAITLGKDAKEIEDTLKSDTSV